MKTNLFNRCFTLAVFTMLQSCTTTGVTSQALTKSVNDIADHYYSHILGTSPETSYFYGIELDHHDGITDNSPAGLARIQQVEDQLLLQLQEHKFDESTALSDWITHAFLLQKIGAEVALRACRTELWNVNQMGGWHSEYAQLAQLQPTGIDTLRAESLARWSKFAAFIDQEIANLKSGLKHGYSAPKTVVQRVVEQVDGLLALETDASPFFAPAKKDGNEEFRVSTRTIVNNLIHPALLRYRDYLADTYLKAARDELSVTANPNGLRCYEASLQSYTTLTRSGKEVFELGLRTVEANKLAVIELGKVAYGLDDFAAILEKARNDPADRFSSQEELLEFSRDAVKLAEKTMPDWFGLVPDQSVEVVPFEKYEEGTGRSAHYNAGTDDQPGEYRIPLFEPENQSRGGAETTAFHETWPGHHMQTSVAQSIEDLHPATSLLWFSGPGEGWARYSETLSDEIGLYKTTVGPILRRAWPARGMVVDPGIHLFGWTREDAISFLRESGRFKGSKAEDMVDRIAILPGQLTAYDSGGLEIFALRAQAEAELGSNFDIREFHDKILENGTIPLTQLREHIEAWISKKQLQ